MYFIIQVDGCLPYVSIVLNEEGEAMSFDDEIAAQRYALENCAWNFQIIEFN